MVQLNTIVYYPPLTDCTVEMSIAVLMITYILCNHNKVNYCVTARQAVTKLQSQMSHRSDTSFNTSSHTDDQKVQQSQHQTGGFKVPPVPPSHGCKADDGAGKDLSYFSPGTVCLLCFCCIGVYQLQTL